MFRYAPLLGFLMIAGLCAGLLLNRRDPAVQPSALIGRAAPPLGQPVEKGAAVLVNFFASWCLSCAAEQDVLALIARDTGVKIYGVDYKDTKTAAEAWLAAHGNPYAVVAPDPLGKAAIDWGVTGVPETFVVDAGGIVRYRYAGAVTDEVYKKDIAPLLKETAK